MSNCVCGRTTRKPKCGKPMCDKSCSLSEEQYLERSKRLEELLKPAKLSAKSVKPNLTT